MATTRRRRRDRRGRGPRGHVVPPHLPGHRSPAERFDDLVADSVDRLRSRWTDILESVDVGVEDVPAGDPGPWDDGVPLGRAEPWRPGRRALVVVYRRPLLDRAADDLARAVHLVVVEQVASVLGRRPEEIDPDAGWDAD